MAMMEDEVKKIFTFCKF